MTHAHACTHTHNMEILVLRMHHSVSRCFSFSLSHNKISISGEPAQPQVESAPPRQHFLAAVNTPPPSFPHPPLLVTICWASSFESESLMTFRELVYHVSYLQNPVVLKYKSQDVRALRNAHLLPFLPISSAQVAEGCMPGNSPLLYLAMRLFHPSRMHTVACANKRRIQ